MLRLKILTDLDQQAKVMAYVTCAIKVNKSGRTYHKSKPPSLDVRQNVIDKLMQSKTYADDSKDLGIAKSSVTNIVKLYNQTGDLVPVYQHNRRDLEKVSFGDSALLETIVGTSGTTSLEELQRELELSDDCGRVSLPTISRLTSLWEQIYSKTRIKTSTRKIY